MTFDLKTLGRLGITEEQVELMNVAEKFCRDTSDFTDVRKQMTNDRGFETAVWEQISALGWLGIAIPENYGGVGLSLAEVVPVAEQMGRRMMALPFVPTTIAAQSLIGAGTEKQKQLYLPEISEGLGATVALSELNGSFDLTQVETVATRTNDGFSLTGCKILVQNLDSAKIVIISAMLDGKISLFVVERDLIDQAAFRREIIIDETKRSFELTLNALNVPADVLMNQDLTPATLQRLDLAANLLGSAELVGGAQSCIDYTVDYLKTRKQFGKLIGSYQALKHTVVDAYVSYEKARSLVYAAAHSFEEQGKGEVATRMAVVGAVRALSFAADRAIQFHGGFGFTYDCDAQLYRRRAIFQDSLFGNTRWHKKKLAALLFA